MNENSIFAGFFQGFKPVRQRERAALTIYRALEARNAIVEQAIGGGSAPAPARTPRAQRRTSARKPANSGDDDGDSEPARRFTISTSPADGMVIGAAGMCTAFMLMAQYGGKAIVPIEAVCADYFAPLTLPNLRRKIAAGDISLPLVRMEAESKKAAQGIHLQDLANYIDVRRAAAVKERDQLCG
ncbi:Pyocin activator protein PrtN [Caballeronia sp. SBC1]|uniref:pyocin activator PrtN family protein n=1 Tax=unclassified Caballeronia TaxID=2646786 RepID=UPI0013E13647|nr:Pyocin activator protein PrtN [Caballeronia sp. SBC2]QIN61434.1 Pyocin activator protein PrtN [Caballeronia sp. SBC1]